MITFEHSETKIGDNQWGIYWLKDLSIHRGNMTEDEARKWMEESQEIFSEIDDVYSVWGICKAQWEVANV